MKSPEQLSFDNFFDIIPVSKHRSEPSKPAFRKQITVKVVDSPMRRVSKSRREQNGKKTRFYSQATVSARPIKRIRRNTVKKDTAIDTRSLRLTKFTNSPVWSSRDQKILHSLSLDSTDLPGARRKAWLEKGKAALFRVITELFADTLAFLQMLIAAVMSLLSLVAFQIKKVEIKSKTEGRALILLLVGVFVVTFMCTYAAMGAVSALRQNAQSQQQSDAEWTKSVNQWQCELAQYQASQSGVPLNQEKEALCASIK